ncbi:MAG TPA: hypothetical protein VNU26_06500, partial [Mycobacteriales bacterium]|nr:hypothetical protein [Mycobacteriales bacterium]
VSLRVVRLVVGAVDAQGYEDDVAGGAGGATVLVVPGRPRYHVDGCRYLTGKDVEEVGVEEARSQYSPCGVCKPDAVLAAEAAPVEEDLGDTGVPGTDEVVEEPPAPRRRSGSTRTTAGTRGARKAPARSPRTTGAATAATGVGTVDPVVEEPAPGGPVVPAKSTARRKVVVIPDRARFHTPDCRFVRDALGTEELSRSAATKQGYQACGVCKP